MAAQRFVYYRVRAHDADAAVSAMRALQAGWMASTPELRCDLLRRVDDKAHEVTLMETYACNISIAPDAASRIETEALQALSRWLIGERHVEVFAPCA